MNNGQLIIPENPNLIPLGFASMVMRHVDHIDALDEVNECRRRTSALRQYVAKREHKIELQAGERWCEVRIGEILGPAIDGRHLSPLLQGKGDIDSINCKNRHEFRKLAAHRDFVANLIASGEVRRKKLLEAIDAKERVESSPTSVGEGVVEDLQADLIDKGKKFSCIYADPPWKYGNQGTRASTDNHYPTMSVEEICALPVGQLAADKAHLWLWTTNGFLFECPRLFAAWGFEFKSSYVWVKPQIGIGNYLRNSHELLLLGVRGGLVGQATDVQSWGLFERGQHSSKPEQIRLEVVEKVSPGPYLELFARSEYPGWSVWGNQIESTLFKPSKGEVNGQSGR